jgi:uncharacterized glyoxalase superfamily protein PhnB
MTKLHTIGIIAADMKKTLDFYRILGLEIPEGLEGEDNVDVKISDAITLGFLSEALARHADSKFQTPVGQSMNLQFECSSASEVDATFQRLIDHQYEGYAEPWDAFWGQRFARIKDPDGRVVNLFAQL